MAPLSAAQILDSKPQEYKAHINTTSDPLATQTYDDFLVQALIFHDDHIALLQRNSNVDIQPDRWEPPTRSLSDTPYSAPDLSYSAEQIVAETTKSPVELHRPFLVHEWDSALARDEHATTKQRLRVISIVFESDSVILPKLKLSQWHRIPERWDMAGQVDTVAQPQPFQAHAWFADEQIRAFAYEGQQKAIYDVFRLRRAAVLDAGGRDDDEGEGGMGEGGVEGEGVGEHVEDDEYGEGWEDADDGEEGKNEAPANANLAMFAGFGFPIARFGRLGD